MIDSVVFSPLKGFFYFLTHPRLWFRPLFITLIAGLLLGLVFSLSTWSLWPKEITHTWEYALHGAKAIGLGSLIAVLSWAFFISLLLSYAFDVTLRKALKQEGLLSKELPFLPSFAIGISVMMKTLKWRIFWPVATLVAMFFLPFAAAFIGQMGIGHMAVIDSCGMTMSFMGYNTEKQLGYYKEFSYSLLVMGFFAGLGSFFLLPTFIGWLYWIPGIYIGAAFWIQKAINTKQ